MMNVGVSNTKSDIENTRAHLNAFKHINTYPISQHSVTDMKKA